MQYTEEELLAEVRRLAQSLGHPPTLQDMRDEGAYAAMTYYNRFGSWQNALEAAGFASREPESEISAEELSLELRRLADDDNSPPTARKMNEEGKYWASTYRRRFGSWRDALKAAGFDPPQSTVSDADLLAELRRLADGEENPPTFADMEADGVHGAKTYVRRFGSWNAALEAAGFVPRSSSEVSEDDLLAELQRLADEIGDQPTAREMDETGKYAAATYQRCFGSWNAALKEVFDEV